MKTTKRVLAVALAVLMLALAIPFAASAAATTYTLTVKCDKDDYTYTVYKIADFNEGTGAYENFATTAIGTAIKKSTDSTADVLKAANDATLSGGTELKFDASNHSKSLKDLAAGMYYIKCTGVSINNDSVTQNNIVPLPNKNMAAGATTYTVDVATNKIKEGGEPSVYKDIKKADGSLVKETSVNGDDTITYVLKADVTGTKDNKLAKYIIADDMDTTYLSLDDVHIESVQLVNGSDAANIAYDPADSADLSSDKGYTYDFGVSISATELNKDSFYTAGNQVVVTFTTKLTSAAKEGIDIINKDGLKYENKSGNKNEVMGEEVKVYTFKISVEKVDADDNNIKLAGAKFKVYKNYNESTKELSGLVEESAETGRDGVVSFNYKFAEGTYYVQESQAPSGYNLNSTVFTVNVSKDTAADSVTTVTVTDTKSKLPNTGGEGTMVFTIVGASLIAAAGILLAVVLKKRAK